MRCKIEPIVERIVSPVILVFPDDSVKRFQNGKEAFDCNYEQRYIIHSIASDGETIKIQMVMSEVPTTNTFF